MVNVGSAVQGAIALIAVILFVVIAVRSRSLTPLAWALVVLALFLDPIRVLGLALSLH
jgi:hypothetical protein